MRGTREAKLVSKEKGRRPRRDRIVYNSIVARLLFRGGKNNRRSDVRASMRRQSSRITCVGVTTGPRCKRLFFIEKRLSPLLLPPDYPLAEYALQRTTRADFIDVLLNSSPLFYRSHNAKCRVLGALISQSSSSYFRQLLYPGSLIMFP